MSLFQKDKTPTQESPEILKFNHNLGLLIKQLKAAYPNDKDLKLYGEKFEWMPKGSDVACKAFIETTTEYIHSIVFEKDIEFVKLFKEKGHKIKDENDRQLISKIINLWTTTPEDPNILENHQKLKKNIWSYLKLLLNYGARALNDEQLISQVKTELKAYARLQKELQAQPQTS